MPPRAVVLPVDVAIPPMVQSPFIQTSHGSFFARAVLHLFRSPVLADELAFVLMARVASSWPDEAYDALHTAQWLAARSTPSGLIDGCADAYDPWHLTDRLPLEPRALEPKFSHTHILHNLDTNPPRSMATETDGVTYLVLAGWARRDSSGRLYTCDDHGGT